MAEAISATRAAPAIGLSVPQFYQASSTAASNGVQAVSPTVASTSFETQNPLPTTVPVPGQVGTTDLGPEGRLMQMLRAMMPPMPPPIIPPSTNIVV